MSDITENLRQVLEAKEAAERYIKQLELQIERDRAERDRLREALEAIFDFIDADDYDTPSKVGRWESICERARAALAKEAGK